MRIVAVNSLTNTLKNKTFKKFMNNEKPIPPNPTDIFKKQMNNTTNFDFLLK